MQKKLISTLLNFIFVFVQFGGIAIIILTGPIFSSNIWLFAIQLTGLFIGIWAIFSMQLDNVRILPDLKPDTRFVNKGPYRFIRHPMYLGILLCITPLIISKYSNFRLIINILIFIDLIFKSVYEERLLKKRFENYTEYSKKTYRIIPFIF
jgi:protein-S-isoprenylcysteine O-methyltransferase Ste14